MSLYFIFFTLLQYGSSHYQEVFSENSQDQSRHLWRVRILKNLVWWYSSKTDLRFGGRWSPFDRSPQSRLCRDQKSRGSRGSSLISKISTARIRDDRHRFDHGDLRDHQAWNREEVRSSNADPRLRNTLKENPRDPRRFSRS